jgi:hypothetical protein
VGEASTSWENFFTRISSLNESLDEVKEKF